VLQEEEKKTAETEVGRLQKERKWRLQRGAIERPSVEVVNEPKRRATTADSDSGILAQQKLRRTH